MKLNLIFAAAMLLLLVGCKKATYLESDVKELTMPMVGQSDTINLCSDVNDFTLDSVPAWVKPELNDSILVVTVGKNDTNAKREGNIVVANGNLKLVIPVIQYSKATHLELPDGNAIKIGKEGGSKTIAVDCDGDVQIEGAENFDAKYINGTLSITAPKNDGATFKKKIKLSSDEYSKEVTVILEGNVCATCKGKGKITCPVCGGAGFISEINNDCPSSCQKCGGRGILYPGTYDWETYDGSRRGTGKITCPDCNGKGK